MWIHLLCGWTAPHHIHIHPHPSHIQSEKACERYQCGFAAGSIFVIVASYPTFGLHHTVSYATTALYVCLVAALVHCFTRAATGDPGTVDPPRAARLAKLVEVGTR